MPQVAHEDAVTDDAVLQEGGLAKLAQRPRGHVHHRSRAARNGRRQVPAPVQEGLGIAPKPNLIRSATPVKTA